MAEKYKSHFFFLWDKSLEFKINLTEQTEDYEKNRRYTTRRELRHGNKFTFTFSLHFAMSFILVRGEGSALQFI